ncbi:hypothetical protein [Marinobacter sp. HL-58]|uniref:hypothetical protein n=1 Tax=Marinobacter sp. HL-58 TaxID=1479237 RepID=UPI0004813F92|nr:hypothetical protein [Marinobacter sp. HL-58]KPP97221.1 MAG: hypothetical protein HLUCCO03_09460 [Marinobacter sp. HL-58]
MNQNDSKLIFRKVFSGLLYAVLLTMTGAGMAHQAPDSEGAPDHIIQAAIVSEGDVDALSAMVLDAPRPALMVRYQGEETLVVYDSDNNPFLRFEDNRVEANTRSSHWPALPQSKGYQVKEDEHWVQVSGSASFGWVDPRLSVDENTSHDTVKDWRIPVRQGEAGMDAITGRLSWRSVTTQKESAHD